MTADEHGDFVFASLPPGEYALHATKAGYLDNRFGTPRFNPAGSITLADGERRLDFVITLAKHAVISGSITDETNAPMVGISVGAYRPVIRSGHRRFDPARSTTTDDRGRYRITGLEPGRYLIAATTGSTPLTVPDPSGRGLRTLIYPLAIHPQGVRDAATAELVTVEPAQEITGIDLRLSALPAARVAGVVQDFDASMVTTIQLVPQHVAVPGITSGHRAYADRTGAFVFNGVPAGQYVLEVLKAPASPPSYETNQPQIITQTSSGGSSMWVNVAPRNEPAPAARPLRPSWSATLPVVVGEAGVDNLIVALQEGPKISGRISFDGAQLLPTAQELARFRLQIEPADGNYSVGSIDTVVGENGEFSISGVPPGRYILRPIQAFPRWTLRSVMVDQRDVSIVPLDLDSAGVANVSVVFTDRLSTIQGVAVGADGQPVRRAIVLAFPIDAQLWRDYGQAARRLQNTIATVGRFAMTVPPGDYFVAAASEDLLERWRDPAVLARLAATADRITVGEGDRVTVNARVVSIK